MHHHPAFPPSGDLALLFLASLLGSSHCVAMCGPYVGLCAARIASGGAPGQFDVPLRLLFNAGRLSVYMAIGALAGAFGEIALAALERVGLRGMAALAAGSVTVLLGLVLLGRVRDPAGIFLALGLDGLIRHGASGAFRTPRPVAAFLLGSLQGAFPCALVYAAAARAAATGSSVEGAATMLVFGCGTVPAIFILSSLSPRLLARVRAWRWAGVLVIIVGTLMVGRGLAGLGLIASGPLW